MNDSPLAWRPDPIRFRRVLLPILLAFCASAAIRWWNWRDDRVVQNIEASYHVLLTVEAFNQVPASVHHFLPIVTLGRALDRDVPFGASVRGPQGFYYYTSFPPLGFILPWAFFRATGMRPTVDHLLLFNMGLHLAAVLLLARLVFDLLGALNVAARSRLTITYLASLSYIFAFEAMYSHGIVYWHHSPFQSAWLAQLLAAVKLWKTAQAERSIRPADCASLVVTSLVAASLEWAGYLTTASVAAGCLWQSRVLKCRTLRHVAFALAGTLVLAGAILVTHFVSVIDLFQLTSALAARAEARSALHGSLTVLGHEYYTSFGPLMVFTAGSGLIWLFLKKRQDPPQWIAILLACTLVPVTMNLVLTQHASTYHFDRLKGLVPLLMLPAVMIALMPARAGRLSTLLWAGALAWSGLLLRPSRSLQTLSPAMANTSLLEQVEKVRRPCEVLATDTYPRGWVTLSLRGNVYEGVPSIDSVRRLVRQRGACQGVYFQVQRSLGDAMYFWKRVVIVDARTSRADTITPK